MEKKQLNPPPNIYGYKYEHETYQTAFFNANIGYCAFVTFLWLSRVTDHTPCN